MKNLFLALILLTLLSSCDTKSISTATPIPSTIGTRISSSPANPITTTATKTQKPTHTRSAKSSPTDTDIPSATATIIVKQKPSPTVFVVVKEYLDCDLEEMSRICNDEILQLEFEYPSEWGVIQTTFREGWKSGYLYEYSFQNEDGNQIGGIFAGGRSHDFSEGRGSFITDFKGFASDYTPCQGTSAIICYEIKPGIIFEILASSGTAMCDPGPGHIGYPKAVVKINLPENEKINGFVFARKILSTDLRNDLGAIIGIKDHGIIMPTNCTDKSIEAYDQKITEIADMISLDSQTTQNLNELFELVNTLVYK